MKQYCAALAAGLALAASGQPAIAADIDNITGAAVVNCYMVNGLFSHTGQTFTIPSGETLMTSITIAISEPTTNSSLTLYPISGTTLGAPIATTTFSSATAYPSYSLHTLTLPGAGLAVTPGQTYAILSSVGAGSAHCVTTRGSSYADGSLYQINSGPLVLAEDAIFGVDFATPAIPTMSQWAMILFGLVLAGGAAVMIQRRRLA